MIVYEHLVPVSEKITDVLYRRSLEEALIEEAWDKWLEDSPTDHRFEGRAVGTVTTKGAFFLVRINI